MLKKLVVTSVGVSLALFAAVPDSRADDVYFIADGDFNAAENWSDSNPPSLDDDNHFIQDSLTATYSAGTLSIRKLVVSDGSPGTLNMTGGDLTLAGGILYVADNTGVWKIAPDATATRFAGGGAFDAALGPVDGPVGVASFDPSSRIVVDASGSV